MRHSSNGRRRVPHGEQTASAPSQGELEKRRASPAAGASSHSSACSSWRLSAWMRACSWRRSSRRARRSSIHADTDSSCDMHTAAAAHATTNVTARMLRLRPSRQARPAPRRARSSPPQRNMGCSERSPSARSGQRCGRGLCSSRRRGSRRDRRSEPQGKRARQRLRRARRWELRGEGRWGRSCGGARKRKARRCGLRQR